MRFCSHSRYYRTRPRSLFIFGLLCGVLLLIGIFFPHLAQAQYTSALTEGRRYDNCTVTTTPDGKTTFKFRVQLVRGSAVWVEHNNSLFATWGLAVFFFDANGNRKPTPSSMTGKMNQVASAASYFHPSYSNVRILSGPFVFNEAYGSSWQRWSENFADMEVTVNSSDIAEYPVIAVSMSTANVHLASFIDNQSAFLVQNESDGICKEGNGVITPPPPKKIPLTVKVPDWDFGELKPNDPSPDIILADKLCLKYEPTSAIYSERLLLQVSNQNGTTGQSPNMYKLVHRSDPTAVIPYSMRLLGIGLVASVYRMPNNGPASFHPQNFDRSGETCFAPTYTTRTTTASKPGDYMDTITFTIVNAP